MDKILTMKYIVMVVIYLIGMLILNQWIHNKEKIKLLSKFDLKDVKMVEDYRRGDKDYHKVYNYIKNEIGIKDPEKINKNLSLASLKNIQSYIFNEYKLDELNKILKK